MSQNTRDHAATIAVFLSKWQASGAAERANAQLFLNELCNILEGHSLQASAGAIRASRHQPGARLRG